MKKKKRRKLRLLLVALEWRVAALERAQQAAPAPPRPITWWETVSPTTVTYTMSSTNPPDEPNPIGAPR